MAGPAPAPILFTDPDFADPAGGGDGLQVSSPAISTGDNAWVKSAFDLESQPRIWIRREVARWIWGPMNFRVPAHCPPQWAF